MAHVRSIDRFFEGGDSGDLPSLAIVDPDFRGFSQESPQDIRLWPGAPGRPPAGLGPETAYGAGGDSSVKPEVRS